MAPLSPTAAFCIALGDASIAQARACRATFKLFHPEIPFYVIDEDLYLWFSRQREVIHAGEIVSFRSVIGAFLAQLHPQLIYLDADVLVLDRLHALLDSPEPLIVTADVPHAKYGAEKSILNAGVLAARGPEFWALWMKRIYSQLVPIAGNFLDQLSLRELCDIPALPFRLLPESSAGPYYNVSYWNHPGAWHVRDGLLFRGEAQIALWHFGGGLAQAKEWKGNMPDAARLLAEKRLAEAEAHLDYTPEAEALEALLPALEADYLRTMEHFFRNVGVRLRGDVIPTVHPGLFRSDAPASWDQFRNLEGTGVHRHFLPAPPRFVYAPDPARLREENVGPATLRKEWS